MITVYYWEDDPDAEDLIDELKSRKVEFEAVLLDAEDPNASQSVEYEGKLYDFQEFLKVLDS